MFKKTHELCVSAATHYFVLEGFGGGGGGEEFEEGGGGGGGGIPQTQR